MADQVFSDLVAELDRQGVGRKVSADMFGMGLRTYRRNVQRLRESSTMRGRSLWESVLSYVKENGVVDRAQVVTRFVRDDESQVKAVLHDLCQSQLLAVSGSGLSAKYRAALIEETGGPSRSLDRDAGDDLLVALMYREGPLTSKQVATMAREDPAKVDERLGRLVAQGRIQRVDDGNDTRYRAEALVIPLGAEGGWEGAVFDHFKALVVTVLSRLRQSQPAALKDKVGGSTYTIEVWPGHPMEEEVLATLGRLRASLTEMRNRVVQHEPGRNGHAGPSQRVVIYCGQYVVEEEDENGD